VVRSAGYDGHRAPSTGDGRGGRSLPAVFFTLTALAFACAALILFIFAFRALFGGKIGAAVVFGVLALIMSSVAGAVGFYVD
jgi:hypothetical protein